jgi:hypothetical protein
MLFGYEYLFVGYTYGFPIFPFERPPWMDKHRLSVISQVPARRYDESVTRTTSVSP